METGQGNLRETQKGAEVWPETFDIISFMMSRMMSENKGEELTGVIICERGRRSVTRGRDAVG